jgi:hypothetical protein
MRKSPVDGASSRQMARRRRRRRLRVTAGPTRRPTAKATLASSGPGRCTTVRGPSRTRRPRRDRAANESRPRTARSFAMTGEWSAPPRDQAERRARPRWRRARRVARPPRVDIRLRKPCFRARRRRLGWYVRFIVGPPRGRRPRVAARRSEIFVGLHRNHPTIREMPSMTGTTVRRCRRPHRPPVDPTDDRDTLDGAATSGNQGRRASGPEEPGRPGDERADFMETASDQGKRRHSQASEPGAMFRALRWPGVPVRPDTTENGSGGQDESVSDDRPCSLFSTGASTSCGRPLHVAAHRVLAGELLSG